MARSTHIDRANPRPSPPQRRVLQTSAHNARARVLTLLALALALLATPRDAAAGAVEYLSNQGADYIRTLSRNAATDGADVVVYNPAATTMLGDGLHVALGSQTLLGGYAIEHAGKSYKADVFVPSLPSLQAAWVRGSFAAFAAATVPAGGGSLTYTDGIPYLLPLAAFVEGADSDTPTDGEFAGSTTFYGLTLGGAWRYADLVAVSLGGRLTFASKSYDGHAMYGSKRAELHTSKSAIGANVIAGLTLRPGAGLTVGLRYESKTPMTFKAQTTTVGMRPMDKWTQTALESFADGAKEERPMPAVLGLGVAWQGMGLTLSLSLHRYFQRAADAQDDYDGIPGSGGFGAYVRSWDDDYDDAWDLGGAVEYEVRPGLRASVGYIRASLGGGAQTLSDFEQALDSDTFGGGVQWRLSERWAVTAALSRTMYVTAGNKALAPPLDDRPESFSRDIWNIALGVQVHL